jgi:glutaminyl-peptide cyclotransferase
LFCRFCRTLAFTSLLLLIMQLICSCTFGVSNSTNFTSSTSLVSPRPTPPFASADSNAIPTYAYQIVHVYPHDTRAFTEGLAYDSGFIYESTGRNGDSSLRQVELETGQVLQQYQLKDQYFGEGLAVYQDKLIQLTWKTHVGFVYNKDKFNLLNTFTYSTEGWGLSFDGQHLIMSDGTSELYLLNPDTQQLDGSVKVLDDKLPVSNINELEYVEGMLYANIWQSNKIAIIDSRKGALSAWIDLTGILQTQNYLGQADVLNGIAYDPQNKRLFVTGKLWPYLFEIQIQEIK